MADWRTIFFPLTRGSFTKFPRSAVFSFLNKASRHAMRLYLKLSYWGLSYLCKSHDSPVAGPSWVPPRKCPTFKVYSNLCNIASTDDKGSIFPQQIHIISVTVNVQLPMTWTRNHPWRVMMGGTPGGPTAGARGDRGGMEAPPPVCVSRAVYQSTHPLF